MPAPEADMCLQEPRAIEGVACGQQKEANKACNWSVSCHWAIRKEIQPFENCLRQTPNLTAGRLGFGAIRSR